MNLQRKLIILGSAMGGLSVILGAFGAHALKSVLVETGRTETYELAVRYQFYHTLAILVMAALADKLQEGRLYWAALLTAMGIIVFSGSLYILSLSGYTIWGAVTPLGGVLLIGGWVFLLLAAVIRK